MQDTAQDAIPSTPQHDRGDQFGADVKAPSSVPAHRSNTARTRRGNQCSRTAGDQCSHFCSVPHGGAPTTIRTYNGVPIDEDDNPIGPDVVGSDRVRPDAWWYPPTEHRARMRTSVEMAVGGLEQRMDAAELQMSMVKRDALLVCAAAVALLTILSLLNQLLSRA